MRILGIDPGSAVTGFGVVERVDGHVVHVAHGALRTSSGAPLAARLASLYRDIAEVIELHRPDVAVVEQVFVAASPRSALVLGQARGAALAAIAAQGLAVAELAASQIKQSVVGSGRATKRQVQLMVKRLLDLDRVPSTDAADALAAAIAHSHAARLLALGVAPGARRRPRRPLSAAVRSPR
jgi:crossover junction endodeoxyribonuclease RuvC